MKPESDHYFTINLHAGGGVVLWIHHYILCNGSKHTELLLVTANKQQGKFTNADLIPDSDLFLNKTI